MEILVAQQALEKCYCKATQNCARGGFVIDVKWSDGKLVKLTVVSKAGMPLLLRYNRLVKNIQTIKNRVYTFDASLNKL
jgi:alpha-L-fucosidase 2